MLSGDPHRIWAASWEIVRTREAGTVELGGGLASNGAVRDHALERVAFWTSGSGCLCGLYPRFDRYDPRSEAEAGHVVDLVETLEGGPWTPVFSCRCAACGTRWRVEEATYHLPWWTWRALEPPRVCGWGPGTAGAASICTKPS